jgi:hypothetical protein
MMVWSFRRENFRRRDSRDSYARTYARNISTIAIQHTESPQEEISLPDFINNIEDDLFSDYGNSSKYHKEKKPWKDRSSSHEKIDPFEQAFSRERTVELASIMSGEWLEE